LKLAKLNPVSASKAVLVHAQPTQAATKKIATRFRPSLISNACPRSRPARTSSPAACQKPPAALIGI